MGLIRTSFKLMAGAVIGAYVAQNYNVPNIKEVANNYVGRAKHVEETLRKPKAAPESSNLGDHSEH